MRLTNIPSPAVEADVRSFIASIRGRAHMRAVFMLLDKPGGKPVGTAWIDFAGERDAKLAVVGRPYPRPTPYNPPACELGSAGF